MSQYWAGIGLPWGTSIPSVIEPKDDFDVVKSSILWIILTGVGQRVMEPEFGSYLPYLVFEPNDLESVSQVKEAIREAITRWDDRVEFVDFSVQPHENEMRCSVLFKFATDRIHNDVSRVEFTLSEDMMTSQ